MILQNSCSLTRDGRTGLLIKHLYIEDGLDTVKQVKRKHKARIGREIDSVSIELWDGEAGHQEQVCGPSLHDIRELLQDLRETLLIPDGRQAVHWWADEDLDIRMLD